MIAVKVSGAVRNVSTAKNPSTIGVAKVNRGPCLRPRSMVAGPGGASSGTS